VERIEAIEKDQGRSPLDKLSSLILINLGTYPSRRDYLGEEEPKPRQIAETNALHPVEKNADKGSFAPGVTGNKRQLPFSTVGVLLWVGAPEPDHQAPLAACRDLSLAGYRLPYQLLVAPFT